MPESDHPNPYDKGCSACGKPAVVTEVTVENGKKVERKLCAECAQQAGISVQTNQPLEQIMTSILLSQQQKQQDEEEASEESAARGQAPASKCAACGLSFTEFRNKGLLGCADCYRHFEPALGPLLQRSHEGGSSHCGKVPSRASEALGRQQRLAHLRKELAVAVEMEQYEEAAKLRDEIRVIERGPGSRRRVGGDGA